MRWGAASLKSPTDSQRTKGAPWRGEETCARLAGAHRQPCRTSLGRVIAVAQARARTSSTGTPAQHGIRFWHTRATRAQARFAFSPVQAFCQRPVQRNTPLARNRTRGADTGKCRLFSDRTARTKLPPVLGTWIKTKSLLTHIGAMTKVNAGQAGQTRPSSVSVDPALSSRQKYR